MALSIVRNESAGSLVIPPDWRSVLSLFPDDARDAWEERAAIIQYDGREPRPTAERRAFECIVDAYEEAGRALRAHLAGKAGRRAAPGRRRG